MADTTIEFQSELAAAALGLVPGETCPRGAETSSGDQVLAEGLRAGDEAAYETLILRFEQPVFGMVSHLLEDPADAPDVVQEVFLKVFRNIGHFRGESSLKTWIYRIAINESRNQRRWFGRHRAKEASLSGGSSCEHESAENDSLTYQDWLPDPTPGPFEETFDHELRNLVAEALKRVSGTYRTALILREVEELSYEEIAEILEISLGTVKSRILRGREALRHELRAVTQPAQSPDLQRSYSLRQGGA